DDYENGFDKSSRCPP
ncbi:unnamed protein product, partial [Rotaria sp. Silwood2]